MQTLPPAVIAVLALTLIFVAQSVGTALLAPVLRWGGMTRGFSMIVAWLVFMPLAGSLAMAMALADVSTPSALRVISAAATALGTLAVSGARQRILKLAKESWQGGLGRRTKVAALFALGFLALQVLFAAHPQRLYDQLNYHLVASKRVLAYGGLSSPIFDPHLYIAGPVEYAMLWPRAWVSSDLFNVAVGQAWVFVATVVPMLLATLQICRNDGLRPGLAIAVVFAIPALIPNNELVSMLKPGAFLLSGTFILLLAPVSSRRLLAALALPFMLLFVACNPTYVHASLALTGAIVLVERTSARQLLKASPLLCLSALAFLVTLFKSWKLTGTFLYPNDARFLHSPMADQETLAYWHHIAFSQGEQFWERWWGAVAVPSRNVGLALWLGMIGVVAGFLALSRSRSWEWRGPRFPLAFCLGFVAIWPLFYDSAIYSRFVASYVAGLLAFGVTVLLKTQGTLRRAVLLLTVGLAISVSHAEVMARKIHDWNMTTAFHAYEIQFPRIAGAFAANQWSDARDTVIADDNGKLFFDAAVLFGVLGPGERRAWDELLARPQETALRLRLKAIVVSLANIEKPDGHIPFGGPVNEVRAKLMPYGTEILAGSDLILRSDCFFQAKPCADVNGAGWLSSTPSR